MAMLRLSELKLKDEMRKYFNLKVEELQNRVRQLELKKKFYILTNENDKGCMLYAKHRMAFGQMLGLEIVAIPITSIQGLKDVLRDINGNRIPCMLDMPCEDNIYKAYKKLVAKGLDVEGLDISEWLDTNNYDYAPATPKGIMQFLDWLNIEDFAKKQIAIIGKGRTVGKPLMNILTRYYKNDVMCVNTNSSYEYMMYACKNADIIICASGVKGSIGDFHTSDKKPVLVFNVGTCVHNGKLVNEYQPVKNNIQYTDTKDSVGMLTLLALFDTVVKRMEN
jgi:tetrahydrofolate dehydrogenase/cyclohydrolase, NAD(P)-binding domain protein